MNVATQTNELQLVDRFEDIYRKRMQDLDFVNTALAVEAVGFRRYGDIQLGVLITPWFMNLVILPAENDRYDLPQGHQVDVKFPSGPVNFTAAVDDAIGHYLSAVLFSSVLAIPDQETATELAEEVMRALFDESQNERHVSRRDLFTAAEAS